MGSTDDGTKRYNVVVVPLEATNLPTDLCGLGPGRLGLSWMGQTSCSEAVEIDVSKRRATWTKPRAIISEVRLQFYRGHFVSQLEPLSLVDVNNTISRSFSRNRSTPSCDVDLASVCKPKEGYQIVMHLELRSAKERTLLKVQIATELAGGDARLGPYISFMDEELGAPSVPDVAALGEFASLAALGGYYDVTPSTQDKAHSPTLPKKVPNKFLQGLKQKLRMPSTK